MNNKLSLEGRIERLEKSIDFAEILARLHARLDLSNQRAEAGRKLAKATGKLLARFAGRGCPVYDATVAALADWKKLEGR